MFETFFQEKKHSFLSPTLFCSGIKIHQTLFKDGDTVNQVSYLTHGPHTTETITKI